MKVSIEINGVLQAVEAELLPGGRVAFTADGVRREAGIIQTHPHRYSVLFGDGSHQEVVAVPDPEEGFTFFIHTHALKVRVFDPLELAAMKTRQAEGAVRGWKVKAQMPGKVVAVHVAPGAEVHKGQALLVVEAMKMQNEIAAAAHGRVKSVPVSAGDIVETGTLLVEADPI
jgi:biotin carboxyl carrier protein